MAAHNDINVANTSCNDWQYVSEGGATIVFGYNGPDHPIFTGKVLSLRKIAINHKPCVQISDRNHDGVHLERSAIAFQSRVVSKLMAPKYLPRLQTVHVEKPWLQALRNSSDQVRPDSRRLADTLDIDNNSAVLTTNLVRSRGLVVEIKVWFLIHLWIHFGSQFLLSRNGVFCQILAIYHQKLAKSRQEGAAIAFIHTIRPYSEKLPQ